MMRPPPYWYDPSQPVPPVIETASRIYRFFSQFQIEAKPSYTSLLPVICVGNVTMGGSGKTPVVHALAQLLLEMNREPAIMLRGYGGTLRGPTWVTGQTPQQVGDEALLHIGYAPTMLARDRVAGARMIEQNSKITHIIMDDGLQNPGLKKDLSFLVVDGAHPFGNGRVFPAGPLREPVDSAIKRSDALLILGDDLHDLAGTYHFAVPIFHATIVPKVPKLFKGLPVIAFAGIGHPEKFFGTLEQHGAILFDRMAFPDHYFYKEKDLHALVDKSQKANIPLVTTRKDWVRLPPRYQGMVDVLDIELHWENEIGITELMRQKGVL